MKLSIILGTRPEIIKLSPIIRVLEKEDIDWHIIHTNQHYSENMDKIFFEELRLPKPKYNLNIGSGTHGEQTGKMLIKIEKVLLKEEPDVVVVQGDTNTVLAGALTASKLKIDVAHVEAGLRSFDKNMPEEINRVLTDHISSYLFAPTEIAKNNLLNEGIEEDKIFVVGNTIVDATLQNLKIAEKNENVRAFFNSIVDDNYFLLTLHRAENVDNKNRLKNIIEGIFKITELYDEDVIFPIHPRTKKKLNEFNLFEKLKSNEKIKIIEPVGYLEFLMLEKNAKLILTDSGGVQEEACILKIPCVTLRDNTERPETVEVGANMLVGDDKGKLIKAVEIMLKKDMNWENPFGDGKSGERIVKILKDSFKY
ncbi:non-hydrolyzing UDP-N-acetylglucosamine 2-epimerase [Methanocaldococcus fervens]|uniref:UDP-N-acetylglucosamine 2-epimerase n=1 Tax=Methanocaldococcus fervens (strain DSM 4213 / JCM 15782 / AG86) TaxID=573064 RepID=C7P838_METFA|nr:UDP-N-acetylglucosamine 2-epimerase (non-hydrolyzing) [Methanocaldococcus fervens]ACV24720.1 UDP-N-acetylglucosamine 2-epimerase [Methanocaldococcus fervens AG86]